MRATTAITVIAIMRRTATAPPIMAAVLSEELCELEVVVLLIVGSVVLLVVGSVMGGCIEEYSPSVRDEIATEHSESTVISTPVTTIPAPPLTHSSIREMSEPLSVSEVPSSLARYVTCVGDSE